jgi:hypothetical protein
MDNLNNFIPPPLQTSEIPEIPILSQLINYIFDSLIFTLFKPITSLPLINDVLNLSCFNDYSSNNKDIRCSNYFDKNLSTEIHGSTDEFFNDFENFEILMGKKSFKDYKNLISSFFPSHKNSLKLKGKYCAHALYDKFKSCVDKCPSQIIPSFLKSLKYNNNSTSTTTVLDQKPVDLFSIAAPPLMVKVFPYSPSLYCSLVELLCVFLNFHFGKILTFMEKSVFFFFF